MNDLTKAMQMAQRTYELLGQMMQQLGCPPCKCKEPWEKVRDDVSRMFKTAGNTEDEAKRAEAWQKSMGEQGLSVPPYTHNGAQDARADEFLKQAYRVAPEIKR